MIVALICVIISGIIIGITFFVDEDILFILKDKPRLLLIWKIVPYIATIIFFVSIYVINTIGVDNVY